MDVKEINNVSNILLQGKLNPANSANSFIGGSFAALIGQGNLATELLPSDNNGVVARPKEDKIATNVPDNKKDSPKANKDVAGKDRSDASSDGKKIANKKKPSQVGEAKKAQNEPVAEDGDVVAVPVATEVLMSPEAEAQAAVASGVLPSEQVNEVESVLADDSVLGGFGDVGEVAESKPSDLPKVANDDLAIGGKLENLQDWGVGLDKLAQMGAIQVFDIATGETIITTGAELAAKLVAEANAQNLVVSEYSPEVVASPENVAKMIVSPAVVASSSAEDSASYVVAQVVAPKVEGYSKEGAVSVEGMDLVEDGEFVDLTALNTTQSSHKLSQAQVAEKASDMGEKVAKNGDEAIAQVVSELEAKSGARVEVVVSEEKIAYRSIKDLVKDNVVLEKAIASSAETTQSNAQTSINANPFLQSTSQINLTPVANANVQAQVSAADDVVASRVSAEVSPITMSHASISGSEFVASAKLEAANKNSDASSQNNLKGLGKEVADQIKVNITKSAVKGIDKIDVQLKPEELGHIEIKMQISKDGKLQAHIISNRPETSEMLQKEVQSLEKAFNDAGFQTDEGSFSFSFRGEEQSQRDNNSELRNFIGRVFENEASSEHLSSEALDAQSWGGANGLNIRV